jgi:predicted Zn-dependent peptidase
MEHIAFKGTRKRKSYHILNSLDSVGGELNAYTTREKTCFHATVVRKYTDRAADVLQDVTFSPTFPPVEIEKEKLVVAEEMDMYRDNPEEAIFDDYDAMVFGSHPYGRPILGTEETLAGFSQSTLQMFHRRQYRPDRTVFALTGAVSPAYVEKLARKYFEALTASPDAAMLRTPPMRTHAQERLVPGRHLQAHLIVGGYAPALRSPEYYAFGLINYLLGGPTMNSLLNLKIREKYGLVYSIYSFYNAYVNDGNWGVYAGCDAKQMERVRKLIEKELDALAHSPLSSTALARLKRQFIGGMILQTEHKTALLVGAAKDLLDFGELITLEQIVDTIQSLNPQDLQKAAFNAFSQRFFIAYHPEK